MWKERYEEKMQVYQEEVDAYNRAKRAMKRAEGGGKGHSRGFGAGEGVMKEEDGGMVMEGVEDEEGEQREGDDEKGLVEGGFTAVNG